MGRRKNKDRRGGVDNGLSLVLVLKPLLEILFSQSVQKYSPISSSISCIQ